MTDATTGIKITAFDSTAAAFASAIKNVTSLNRTVDTLRGGLGAIGVGAFAGSLVAFTKNTLDAQDNLFKLSQKTGIAVESLAGLEFAAEQSGVELDKVAKATRTFGVLVAEASDASSASAKKLEQLGLSYRQLKDLSPEKQLLALSDALTKFSSQDQAIAFTSVFGNKMADLIPLLAGGSKNLGDLIEQGKKLNPVTEQSARNAEKFNDQVNLLSKSVGTLGREMVQGMIPGLTRVADKMVAAAQAGGLLKGVLAGTRALFEESFGNPKILGDVGQIRREILKTEESISKLSSKKGSLFFDQKTLDKERAKLAQLNGELEKSIAVTAKSFKAKDDRVASEKKLATELERLRKAEEDAERRKESEKKATTEAEKKRKDAIEAAARVEHEYIKLLKIERQAHQDLLKPYKDSAKTAQDRLVAMQQESQALSLSKSKQISLEQAIEETTIARLEEKKVITKETKAIAEIEKEIAARRKMAEVIRSTESAKKLAEANKQASEQVTQLWVQAGRNIQSALANGIFNFFDDGLKGMVKNVASTVGRIASEFAALKLAQMVGLNQMFGMGGMSGVGMAGAAPIAGGFGQMFMGGASLESMFGNSTQAAAQRGAAALWPGSTAGTGGLSRLLGGITPGSALGAAGLLAASVGVGSSIAGDKKVLGISGTAASLMGAAMGGPIGAVVAGAIGALFGHGPLKFRQQSLQGTATRDGFDGDFTNVFRAKGGLLVGNKHKSVSQDLTTEQQDAFDGALSAFYGSAHKFAENLGISVDLVDKFTKDFQIKSEKNQQLTEEAIGDLLNGLGDDLAKNALPIVDTLRQTGETSFKTLERLSNEFSSLRDGAVNLGASLEYANQLLKESTFEGRSAFVEAAGGIDALAQKTAFFSETFLSDAERIAPTAKNLSDEMQKLGLSSDMTREQFQALVQSFGTVNGITAETLNTLLNLAPAYVGVTNFFSTIEAAAMNLGASADYARQLVTGMSLESRTALVDMAGGSSELVRATQIFNEKFLTESEKFALKSSLVNQKLQELGLSSDLTAGQFKELIQGLSTTPEVRAGLLSIIDEFHNVKVSATDAASAVSKYKLDPGALLAREQKRKEQQQAHLNRLLDFTDNALSGINDHIQKLLGLSGSAKSATESLAPQSVETARGNLLSGLSFSKNGSVRGVKDINALDQQSFSTLSSQSSSGFSSGLDFQRSTGKNLEVLRLVSQAIDKSISAETESANLFQRERNKLSSRIPSFDVGGIVPKTSLAMVHKGERIINPQQNEALVSLLQDLIGAVKSGTASTKDTYTLLRNMTNNGTALNTVAA